MRQSCFFHCVRSSGHVHQPTALPDVLLRLGAVHVRSQFTSAFAAHMASKRGHAKNWHGERFIDWYRMSIGERTLLDCSKVTLEAGFSACSWSEKTGWFVGIGNGADTRSVKQASERKAVIRQLERQMFPAELLLALLGEEITLPDGTTITCMVTGRRLLELVRGDCWPIRFASVDTGMVPADQRRERMPASWARKWSDWRKLCERWEGFEACYRALFLALELSLGTDMFAVYHARMTWFVGLEGTETGTWVSRQLGERDAFHYPARSNAFIDPEGSKVRGSKPDEETFRRVDGENARILEEIDYPTYSGGSGI